MKCAVVNCNKSNDGKASCCSFFRFPANVTLRKKWISFCGRKKFNADTSFVCMDHFKSEDFANNLQYQMGFALKRQLKDGVVPTVNLANSKNKKLEEQRASRIERRENKKIVDFLLKDHSSAIIASNKNCPLQIIENINWYEIENQPQEEQSLEISSLNVDNQSLKVKSLEDEILILKEEKSKSDAELKMIKRKMEKMEKNHKYEKDEMEKCLAKARFELTSIEEKLQIIFTTGQIKKLKNGIKRQTWSEDDIAHSITLYTVSPKMYKLLYKNQFPLPAVRTLQSWAQKINGVKKVVSKIHKN